MAMCQHAECGQRQGLLLVHSAHRVSRSKKMSASWHPDPYMLALTNGFLSVTQTLAVSYLLADRHNTLQQCSVDTVNRDTELHTN